MHKAQHHSSATITQNNYIKQFQAGICNCRIDTASGIDECGELLPLPNDIVEKTDKSCNYTTICNNDK